MGRRGGVKKCFQVKINFVSDRRSAKCLKEFVHVCQIDKENICDEKQPVRGWRTTQDLATLDLDPVQTLAQLGLFFMKLSNLYFDTFRLRNRPRTLRDCALHAVRWRRNDGRPQRLCGHQDPILHQGRSYQEDIQTAQSAHAKVSI